METKNYIIAMVTLTALVISPAMAKATKQGISTQVKVLPRYQEVKWSKFKSTVTNGNKFYLIPENTPEYLLILRAMYSVAVSDHTGPYETQYVFESLDESMWSKYINYVEYRHKEGSDEIDFNAYEIHYTWTTSDNQRMHLKWMAEINDNGEVVEWFPCVHILDASGGIVKSYDESESWDIVARICNDEYFIR